MATDNVVYFPEPATEIDQMFDSIRCAKPKKMLAIILDENNLISYVLPIDVSYSDLNWWIDLTKAMLIEDGLSAE